jgi:AbrB family looped-hinge helix DNA binding protein
VSITTITSKGQITIPKDVRQALDLKAHDQVIFTVEGDRAILTPVRKRPIMELRGALPADRPFTDPQEIREEVRRQRGEMLTQETSE